MIPHDLPFPMQHLKVVRSCKPKLFIFMSRPPSWKRLLQKLLRIACTHTHTLAGLKIEQRHLHVRSRSQHKSSSLQLCFWQRQHIPAVEHQSPHYYYYHLFPLARAPRSQLSGQELCQETERNCALYFIFIYARLTARWRLDLWHSGCLQDATSM